MNKFIQKLLSKKRNVLILVILMVGIISLAAYTILGIRKNIEEMSITSEATTPYFPNYPITNADGKDKTLLQRGEYLTKAGDCIACHTNSPKKGPVFAGGLPMQTPFGTIYTPNITSDKETGIGNWTNEQFIKAMREGISPTGKHYYPAFPYLYFNKTTTDDLLAIKAYLESIPAVHQKNLDNTMIWPFNWRFLQAGWRLLFFDPVKTGPYQYNPKKSTEWNRGNYLVEGLGHCAMCHTPSYYLLTKSLPLGAPIQKYNLTGAPIQGYLAPNITQANLANVSTEELVLVFSHNKLIGGGNIEGPMLEANQDSLRYLTQEDMLAIATYLKSVTSKSPPISTSGKGGAGKGIYDNYCVGCHATGAGNAPKYGDSSSWAPLLKNGLDPIYANAIKGIGGMPAKGTCLTCSDTDIKQAVDYMVSSVVGKAAKSSAPPLKKLTMADGKQIYEANCSVCHASGFKRAPTPGDMTAWKPMIDQGFLPTYLNALKGIKGHPPRGACMDCSDAEIKAAVKYMMQESTTTQDYRLW